MANQVICLRWRTQPNSASMAGDAIASARPLGLFFWSGVNGPVCLSILSSPHGASHSHFLSVRPPATLFLHAALDLYLLAQRNKNRSLYVASHCNQPAAKS